MGNIRISYHHHRLLWCFLLIFPVFIARKCSGNVEFRNFVVVNTLPDGEVETRISYKKISAKETTTLGSKGFGLKYRQILRGNNLLQLIYEDSETLTDCEYLNDEKLSKTFLTNFKNDINNLVTTSNVTLKRFRNRSTIPWMNFRQMRKECQKLHVKLKNQTEHHIHNLNSNNTSAESRRNNRGRRDLGDFLRIPGTKWCGKGYSAEKYTRLGMFSRTDRCCRKHDTSCPFWIGGFSTKYGLYNWRVNTIMHCGCDERFRACLKLVGTSDANMVGKLFFNIVQTQCFVIKYKKRCLKRSWRGKCEKHKFVKHAILRNNLPY